MTQGEEHGNRDNDIDVVTKVKEGSKEIAAKIENTKEDIKEGYDNSLKSKLKDIKNDPKFKYRERRLREKSE